MMKKRIPIIIILIVIILAVIIGIYFLLYKNDNKAITENSSDIDTCLLYTSWSRYIRWRLYISKKTKYS